MTDSNGFVPAVDTDDDDLQRRADEANAALAAARAKHAANGLNASADIPAYVPPAAQSAPAIPALPQPASTSDAVAVDHAGEVADLEARLKQAKADQKTAKDAEPAELTPDLREQVKDAFRQMIAYSRVPTEEIGRTMHAALSDFVDAL